MAVAIAYQPIRIPQDEIWFGFIEEASSTRISIVDVDRTAEYLGHFTYDLFGNVSGTVTAISETRMGAQYYEIFNLSVDASVLFNAVQIEADPELAARIVFAGDDIIYGSSGDDVLQAFAGNNFLLGRGGNDTLIGGPGNDVMEGGEGTNFFVYTGGNDWIADFQVGIDTLEVRLDGLTAEEIENAAASATLLDGNPVIAFGGGNTLTLNGLSLPEASSVVSAAASGMLIDDGASPTQTDYLILFHDLGGRYGTFDPRTGDIEVVGDFGQVLTDITYAGSEGILAIDFSTMYEVDLLAGTLDFRASLPTTEANSLGFTQRPHIDGNEPYLLVAGTDGQWYSIGNSSGALLGSGELPDGYFAAGDTFWYERGDGTAEWVVSAQRSGGLLGQDYAFIRYRYEVDEDGISINFLDIAVTGHEIPDLWGLGHGGIGTEFYGVAGTEIYRFSLEPYTVTQIADISYFGFQELAGATAIPASLLGVPEFETVWSIESVSGDDETVFTITRDRSDTSETVYASTVQSPTPVNDGIYDGFADQMLVFAPGVASRQVTVSWNADRTITDPKEFSLIIQADPTEPPSTFLARDFFTVQPADGVAPPPIDDDTVPPPADGDHLTFSPSTRDLEFLARIVAYERLSDVIDSAPLPQAYHLSEDFGRYHAEIISAPFLGAQQGFYAIGLSSPDGTAEPVLAIRGSQTAIDWYDNLVNLQGVGAGQFDGGGWEQVRQWLAENPGAHLTGHSQGGAQAQLVAARATGEGIEIGQLATFNSPGIAPSRAAAFDPSDAGPVHHFIASGDVVSMVGLEYLPGAVTYYNFDTWDQTLSPLYSSLWRFGVDIAGPSLTAAYAHAGAAHTGHWSQSSLREVTVAEHRYFEESYQLTPTQLSSNALSSPLFSHLYSGGAFDSEYWKFLMTIASVPPYGPSVATALTTRGSSEGLRLIPDLFAKSVGALVDLGNLVLDASVATVARMWNSGVTVSNWTADTFKGVVGWIGDAGVAKWEAVRDWTSTQWDGLVGWGAKQWGLAKDFAADVWGDMRNWTSDVWESSLNWGVEAFNNVKSFGASVAQGIGDVANAVGDATAAVGTATMDFFRGSTTLWGMTSRGQDVEVVAADGGSATHATSTPAIMVAGAETTSLASAGAGSGFVLANAGTNIEMSGGANTVFGDAGTLDNSELTGFGSTDRIIYANMTVGKDAEKVDGGSAIVSIDVNGDGVADTSLRLVGEYDLEAFRLLPHADGMALFYGPPPVDEVAEVRVAISGRDGAPLAGAELMLVRPSGSGTIGQADEDGRVVFEVMRGVEGDLQASTEVDTDAPWITAVSALEALRMAVGLSPSWGPADAMDFIAADFNGDGQVSAADALDILRVAVGLAAEDQPRWIFVETDADLSHVSRTNTQVEQGLRFVPITDDIADLGLTGILVGNVQEYA